MDLLELTLELILKISEVIYIEITKTVVKDYLDKRK